MFQNYLKVAIRNLLKNKIYSIVNISGLVIGLTCSMLIIVYVLNEHSYDRFHENAEYIYRLGKEAITGDKADREPLSSAPTAKALLQDFPEVANIARFKYCRKTIVKYRDKKFYESHISYVDPSAFDIFTLAMISGEAKTALTKPYSIVITEQIATKYFGTDNPLGKVLQFNNEYDYHVTGVMKNIPENSHLELDMLCSMETLYSQNDPTLENWLAFEYFTYVQLKDQVDYEQFESKFPAFIDKYISDDLKDQNKSIKFFLHPLTKIQLYSHLEGFSPGRITQVYIFFVFALCMLLTACINFMNLTTARSLNRAREVGIRKVVGANRSRLIYQFLGEALILSLISLLISLLIVQILIPYFSTLIRQQLHLNYIENPELILGFLVLAILVGIISGSYPAFYLSRFQPTQVLKGKITSKIRKINLRSGLVVFQFFMSTVFMIQTFIFSIQIGHLRNMDTGFNKEHVVVLPIVDDTIKRSIKSFKQELNDFPAVLNVAATSTLPGWSIPRSFKIPQGYAEDNMQLMDDINVDDDFISTLEIEMAAGRNFSEQFGTDQQDAIIINETAARTYGWEHPVGKTIRYSIGPDKFARATVCGVVKDFHLVSFYRKIEPLFISNKPDNINYLLLRVQPDNMQKTIAQIQQMWNNLYSDYPFEYSFLDNSYDGYFRILEKVLQAFVYFIFLTIFIACLGIFALATYNSENRIKEIGIRKVLGASTFEIMLKLNKEIMILVFIAIVLASLFMQIPFLDPTMFLAYFSGVKYTVYLKSAILISCIAVITISYQAIKTALTNPVKSLRYE